MCTGQDEFSDLTKEEFDKMFEKLNSEKKPTNIVIKGSAGFIKKFNETLEEYSKKYIIGCDPYEK